MQQVINTVGAVSLRASLNCDAFASAHSSDAHYDKASFVGLAVLRGVRRAPRESLCCGAPAMLLSVPLAHASHRAQFQTQGQVRLAVIFLRRQSDAHIPPPGQFPGSVAQRQLLDSFSRMLPGAAPQPRPPAPRKSQLLSHPTRAAPLLVAPHPVVPNSEELQRVHRQDQIAAAQDAPKAFVNSAKSRAIARADKKTAARAAGSGTTAILPTAAAAASPCSTCGARPTTPATCPSST